MKKVLTLSLVATLSTSGLALAHGGGERHFARLDANGDGRVTEQEMLQAKLKHFDEADANRDGKLTPAERKQAFEAHKAARFEKKDANGDGFLSMEELGHMPAKHFARLDANGDGKLSKQEMAAFHPGRGGRRGHHGPEADSARAAKWQELKDATFERDQVQSHVSERFAKLDKNGDAALTPDELRRGGCHHGKRGGHGKGKRGRGAASDAGV